MSQHDFEITAADADTGTTFRAEVNAALQALASCNSGLTAPASPRPFQLWFVENATLKIRDHTNSTWKDFWDVALGGWCWRGSGNAGTNASIGGAGLVLNTTGVGNTCCGYYSMYANTAGNWNTSYGTESLRANTTGSSNSAFGYYALKTLVSGGGNSAFGIEALKNTTGNFNSAFGSQSLMGCGTGNSNSGFGASAGRTVTTGSENTFVGLYAGYHASQKVDAQNSTAIGAYAYTAKDNQVVIGDTRITETVLRGRVLLPTPNIATSAPPASATAAGTAGDVAYNASYVYICVATNTWKRAALSSW